MSARCPGLGATSRAAARFFVQLSRSSSSGVAPRPAAAAAAGPVLDVLLPRPARAASRPAGLRPLAAPRRAAFSTTAARRRTVAVHNPQKDDEGRDMTMEITPRAAERLSKIMAKDANPHLALRIQVESGGCHGFQYLMSLTTLPASFGAPATTTSDKPDEAAADVAPSTTTSLEGSEPGVGEDDTVFAYFKDGEGGGGGEPQPPTATPAAAAAGAPRIIMDGPSLELLKGSKVDFTMELIGSQFKIVDNPLATSSCGCGTSFDIKM